MQHASNRDTLLYAVGDIGPDRKDPREPFELVRDQLRQADIGFCQLECNLTAGGTRLPQSRHTFRGDPAIAPALRDSGFNVVSFAGNHCMDWGREAFLETIETLKANQIAVVGVGANIAQARTPVVVTANGIRVAFLAYSSILPMSYWAEENRPGCAPMRAWTVYEQIEHDQPGTPSRIHTFPNRDDLRSMVKDIGKAKATADVVVISYHWGIHFVPAVIADYQRDVAHAAIDAGADLVLGHHAHILKGVVLYRGKAIMYSLCNFAMDCPMDEALINSKSFREIQSLNPDWNPSPTSLYNFPTDSRKSVVVKGILRNGRLSKVSLLPTYINEKAQPQILAASDARFDSVTEYLTTISRNQDLDTSFKRSGDELVLIDDAA